MGSTKRLTATMADSGSEASSSPAPKRVKPTSTSKGRRAQNDNDDDDLRDQQEALKKQMLVSKQHNKLKEELEARDDELAQPGSSAFDEVLGEVQAAFKNIEDVKLAGQDSQFIRILSEKLTKQASNIGESSRNLNATSLSNKLNTWFKQSESSNLVDFEALGKEVKVFFRSIPTYDCMLGPIAVKLAPKKEKVKKEKKAFVDHPVEKPKELRSSASGVAGDDENVIVDDGQNLFKLHTELQNEFNAKLKSANDVGMFDAVIDPKSFTQTVENIFALTFLVKDGVAALHLDKDELPHVKPLLINNGMKHKVEGNDVQFIATFTHEDWERITKEFEIEQGLLAHRLDNIYDDARPTSSQS